MKFSEQQKRDIINIKIKRFLDNSELSLTDLFRAYDPGNIGKISKSSVSKAFSKIGIQNMNERQLADEIDYEVFAKNLEKTV